MRKPKLDKNLNMKGGDRGNKVPSLAKRLLTFDIGGCWRGESVFLMV